MPDWRLCGKSLPKDEIQFFVQVSIITIVVFVSLYNLTIHAASRDLWISLLCSSLGYILPNPTLTKHEPLRNLNKHRESGHLPEESGE